MIGPKLRFAILERDGYKCHYCGVGAAKAELEIDHVKPRSKGGTDDASNLVTSCWECNNGKRDRAVQPRRKKRVHLDYDGRTALAGLWLKWVDIDINNPFPCIDGIEPCPGAPCQLGVLHREMVGLCGTDDMEAIKRAALEALGVPLSYLRA